MKITYKLNNYLISCKSCIAFPTIQILLVSSSDFLLLTAVLLRWSEIYIVVIEVELLLLPIHCLLTWGLLKSPLVSHLNLEGYLTLPIHPSYNFWPGFFSLSVRLGPINCIQVPSFCHGYHKSLPPITTSLKAYLLGGTLGVVPW